MTEATERLHVLGRQELALLAGGEGNIPSFLDVEEETDEDVIPDDYGVEQAGCVMRSMTEFSLYHEGKSRR